MSEVVAIVEGQTEMTFVRDHLAAHLGGLGIAVWPVLSGKSRRQGGVRRWAATRGDIMRALKEGRYVTTMFDFYGMPDNWPGRVTAAKLPWDQRGPYVESEIIKDIAEEAAGKFDIRQLIPYVQVHEFEALLFADVVIMAETLKSVTSLPDSYLSQQLQQVVNEAGKPEAINDSYDTCPSRRIQRLVPSYDKVAFGSTIAGRIGLDTLRKACPHFGQWLMRLEALSVPVF